MSVPIDDSELCGLFLEEFSDSDCDECRDLVRGQQQRQEGETSSRRTFVTAISTEVFVPNYFECGHVRFYLSNLRLVLCSASGIDLFTPGNEDNQ